MCVPCGALGSEKPPACSRAHCCLSAPNPATNGDAGGCENIKIGEAPLLGPAGQLRGGRRVAKCQDNPAEEMAGVVATGWAWLQL